MASNQKLTRIITGRVIHALAPVEGVLTLTFTDGSTMKIKTAPSAPVPPTVIAGATVKKVRQKGTQLSLDLVDGTTLFFHTAEATSSVMLRDAAGKLEYAD